MKYGNFIGNLTHLHKTLLLIRFGWLMSVSSIFSSLLRRVGEHATSSDWFYKEPSICAKMDIFHHPAKVGHVQNDPSNVNIYKPLKFQVTPARVAIFHSVLSISHEVSHSIIQSIPIKSLHRISPFFRKFGSRSRLLSATRQGARDCDQTRWPGKGDLIRKNRYCSSVRNLDPPKESLIFTFFCGSPIAGIAAFLFHRQANRSATAGRGSDPVPISTQDPQPPGAFGKMVIPIFGKL